MEEEYIQTDSDSDNSQTWLNCPAGEDPKEALDLSFLIIECYDTNKDKWVRRPIKKNKISATRNEVDFSSSLVVAEESSDSLSSLISKRESITSLDSFATAKSEFSEENDKPTKHRVPSPHKNQYGFKPSLVSSQKTLDGQTRKFLYAKDFLTCSRKERKSDWKIRRSKSEESILTDIGVPGLAAIDKYDASGKLTSCTNIYSGQWVLPKPQILTGDTDKNITSSSVAEEQGGATTPKLPGKHRPSGIPQSVSRIPRVSSRIPKFSTPLPKLNRQK